MILNYFKIAWRSLLKYKATSFISVFGLVVGFVSCLLIGSYVIYEFSYDRYHRNSARIYRLVTAVEGSTYENGIAKVSAPWAVATKQSVPEVEDYTRFRMYGDALIKQGTSQFYESDGFYADASALKLFSWNLLNGNPSTALAEPDAIVITQSMAKKYFPEGAALGRTLNFDNQAVYKVTGVVQDPPATSHFRFSFLISMASYRNDDILDWKQSQYYTYLLLKQGSSVDAVTKKIDHVLKDKMEKETGVRYSPFLQALPDIHLHSNLFREISVNGDKTTVDIFQIVAFIILIVACVNFVNLYTARSANRAKEIAVRKTNGAIQFDVVKQFLLEALITGFIAGVIAYGLAVVAISPFANLMDRSIDSNILKNPQILLFYSGLILVTSLLSGIYPAVILSSFKPGKVLKGDFSFKSNNSLRKGLVVFQFTLSTALIIAMLVMSNQIRYVRQKDLGFNKDQIIIVPLQDQQSIARVENIKQRLSNIPGINSISASANQPGGNDWGLPYVAIGLPKEQQPSMRCLVVDEDFLKTYVIPVTSGRAFSKQFATDTTAYLINETAAKQLGWKDPIGKQLSVPAIGKGPGPIVGVIKDFHYHSLHETIEPLYIFIHRGMFSQLNIRIDKFQTSSALTALKNTWSEIEPNFPFRYTFLDENFQSFYEKEQRTSRLLFWFTMMAIFISSLGLYALSALVATQRKKEIGIRKVLGASVGSIVVMLSKEFCKLVIIALIIATPFGWYLMNEWLQNFTYRTDLEWWIFLSAGTGALLIALMTISFQSVRAALTNPVKNLRSE